MFTRKNMWNLHLSWRNWSHGFSPSVAAVGARLDSDEIQKSLKPGAFPVAEWHETQMRNDMG